jgi:hypothetical protein
MSEESMPPSSADKPPPAKSDWLIAVGFVVGALFWLPPLTIRDESALAWLLIVPFAEPPVGIMLAIIRPTRKLGLGVLLAAGVGWLILGAMCAGVLG